MNEQSEYRCLSQMSGYGRINYLFSFQRKLLRMAPMCRHFTSKILATFKHSPRWRRKRTRHFIKMRSPMFRHSTEMMSTAFGHFTNNDAANIQTLLKSWCRQYLDISQRMWPMLKHFTMIMSPTCSNIPQRESHTSSNSSSKLQFALATLVALVLIHDWLLIRVECQ